MALKQVLQQKILLGLDAKRAYCNYRGLGSYSRLLVESLIRWSGSQPLELSLFTPKISLPGLQKWPEIPPHSSVLVHRVEPQGFWKGASSIWRGMGQTHLWPKRPINLYHGLSHELPWNVEEMAKKVKTLVTIHDLIFIRQPELYPWWDRWTYLKKVKHACRVADSILVISEQTKKDLQEYLEIPDKKIKIIYQAIHPRYYKNESSFNYTSKPSELKVQGERPYFLFVGAFEERKNILKLLKAFALVQKKIPDYDFILIGRGRLKVTAQQLIQSLNIDKQVRLLSDISSEELPTYYQNAVALVYPSLFEGFGLPIAEALMSETLVLTSEGSCFPEAGGPAAFYVNPYSEEALAQGLLQIAQLSVEERVQRIAQGRAYAQKFHWQQTAKELLDHYQSILKES